MPNLTARCGVGKIVYGRSIVLVDGSSGYNFCAINGKQDESFLRIQVIKKFQLGAYQDKSIFVQDGDPLHTSTKSCNISRGISEMFDLSAVVVEQSALNDLQC